MMGAEPLPPRLQKASYGLMAAAVVVFASALSLGFFEHAASPLVYWLLGVTTLSFAVVVFMMLKPAAFSFLDIDAAKRQAGVDGAPAAEPGPDVHAEAPAVPPPEPVGDPPLEPMGEPPESPSPGAPTSSTPMLLSTTLGEVLLAAIRSDPEGAGRLFARALSRVDAAVSHPDAGRFAD
jgi:hypothetical protein